MKINSVFQSPMESQLRLEINMSNKQVIRGIPPKDSFEICSPQILKVANSGEAASVNPGQPQRTPQKSIVPNFWSELKAFGEGFVEGLEEGARALIDTLKLGR